MILTVTAASTMSAAANLAKLSVDIAVRDWNI
jgi:hypothetical protein